MVLPVYHPEPDSEPLTNFHAWLNRQPLRPPRWWMAMMLACDASRQARRAAAQARAEVEAGRALYEADLITANSMDIAVDCTIYSNDVLLEPGTGHTRVEPAIVPAPAPRFNVLYEVGSGVLTCWI